MQGCEESLLDNKKTNNFESAEGKYKTLFEQVNAAAFLTTLNGQILEANHKSCDLLGYDWKEVLHLSLKDIVVKDTDWEQLNDEIAARGGLNFETECINKNGSSIPVEVSFSLFRMDNKPVMFVLIWDITDRKKSEKKLKEKEKKYRGLFEFTTDGILVLDAHGDILDSNTKMCTMLSMTKEEIIGKNLFGMEILTAKSQPIVVNQFHQLLSEKNSSIYTTEIKSKNNLIFDVEISSFFLVKKDNEVDNFVLIIRDITERNDTDRKRIYEHSLLKTLMENIPDSVYFKDEKNRFILVNKSKAEHYNVSEEGMIGKTDFDFLPHDQAQKAFDDDNKIMQTGQQIINKMERITHSDGSDKWISVTKIPRYNSEGDIIGTMGISRDVTIQEKAENELVKSEERYRAVFENSSFAIILTNENGEIISWNKLVEELLGMQAEDLLMKRVETLYPPDEWNKIYKEYVEEIGIKKRIETKILRKDCKPVDVDLSVNVLKSKDGKILGATEIIGDITKRKEVEEELEKNHELLENLMDTIPDSIYFKDSENKFLLVNKTKADHWDTKPEEMIGKTDFDFLPHEQAQKAFDDDNQILKTGKPILNKIEKITGSDGLERWFSVTKVPRYDKSGKIVGTIGISRNITGLNKDDF